jgi:predicted MFS family arabinose efflux permease
MVGRLFAAVRDFSLVTNYRETQLTLGDLFRPFLKATLLGATSVLGFYFLGVFLRIDYTVSTIGEPIPPIAFVIFSIAAGIGAWLMSYLLLKNKTPRRTALTTSWVVLAASIVTPLSGTTDPMLIFWLMVTHFAIGVPLIMAMSEYLPETSQN